MFHSLEKNCPFPGITEILVLHCIGAKILIASDNSALKICTNSITHRAPSSAKNNFRVVESSGEDIKTNKLLTVECVFDFIDEHLISE